MEVTLNGEKKQLPENITAAQLLAQLQIAPERVVVELNMTMLKRAQLTAAFIKSGDQIEIVHFVGGG